MSLTRLAIEKNRVTIVALFVVLVGGIQAFLSLPRAEDPGFVVRVALVLTYFPGASPERVEQLVTDKLEKTIQEMPEIDFIRSESKTGVSVIYVIIQERYRAMRPIWDSLRRKVDRARAELPDTVVGPIVNDEFGDVFGTIVTVTGEGYSYAELSDIVDEVRDELLLVEQVAKVEIYGAQDERIFVEYNNARLAELGLSPRQLQQILEGQNIVFPGGHVTTEREQIVLEPTGSFTSIQDLRSTLISVPERRDRVYLGDIAAVSRGYVDPPAALMRTSGRRGLALAISLREGGNISELGANVRATIERLQGLYPIGVEFEFVAFQADHVRRSVNDLATSLLQAVTIVLVTMLIALGMRTGLVVASLIPMALLMSMLIMAVLGIGLDQMSLASLLIALGLLVDNAIVMAESIMVQMAAGKRAVEAAVESAAELRVPLLTSSLTTAAAFLPIYLAESSTGEYTAPLFKVVTITLLCSWLLALTVTPLLCVLFLKVKKTGAGADQETWFSRRYRTGLVALLRHRVTTLVLVAAAFVLAVRGLGYVPNIFFPANDKAIVTAEFTLPTGTPIERTDAVTKTIDEFIARELLVGENRDEGVVNWVTFVGEGAPRFVLNYDPEPPKPEYAVMIINATSPEASDEAIERIRAFCFEEMPDLIASVNRLVYGPPPASPVEIRVSGSEEETVFALSDRVRARLEATAGSRNVHDDWGQRTKKLLVKVDPARASRAGLSNLDVAMSLQTVLTGYQTTEFREEDKIIPVTLRSVAAEREDLGKLGTHNVFSQVTGQSVPLKQVADLEVVWQPAVIHRRDGLKTVSLKADVSGDVTPIAVSRELEAWLVQDRVNWPVGYRYELGGELENSVKANASIGEKLPVGALLILLLLVMQFNSIRRPLIILTTIPLAMIGVTIGLLVTRTPLGFMTFLGIISLAGIVINNAIVLLDRIRIDIEENGLDPARAVIEASQRRLRPILLTSVTTIGGLLPLWLGGGPMWQPLAVAIIFGLAFSTVLTLGVVPVLYSLLFRVSFRADTH